MRKGHTRAHHISQHRLNQDFIGAIVDGTTCDLSGELAVKVLQLCFATYQASMERRTIDVARPYTSPRPST